MKRRNLNISVLFLIFLLSEAIAYETEVYSMEFAPPFDGPLTPNCDLCNPEMLLKGQVQGPESLILDGSTIYSGTVDGKVLQIKDGQIAESLPLGASNCDSFDDLPNCGRVLGIRWLNGKEIVVADAYLGIILINLETKEKRVLLPTGTVIDELPITFPNDLDVLDEDTIIFSDVSTKWDIRYFFHIMLEGIPNGRVIRLKVSTGQADVLLKDLYFPNGIQIMPDRQSVLISETSMARIIRFWFAGPEQGNSEIFANNLPGYPDNIRPSTSGSFYVGMAWARLPNVTNYLDILGPLPFIRSGLLNMIPDRYVLNMLPYFMPKYGLVVELNMNGTIISSMHDPMGNMQEISQATDNGTHIFIGSFHNDFIGVIPKKLKGKPVSISQLRQYNQTLTSDKTKGWPQWIKIMIKPLA